MRKTNHTNPKQTSDEMREGSTPKATPPEHPADQPLQTHTLLNQLQTKRNVGSKACALTLPVTQTLWPL